MNKNKQRHIDLSAKFMEMGQALVTEGFKDNDNSIIQSGNVFIMLGGMILEEVDMFEFIDYLGKFSSQKLLNGLQASGSDVYERIIKMNDISIEDYIKELNRLKNKKSDEESDDTNKDEETE